MTRPLHVLDGFNVYQYVGGSPVMSVDPYGLFADSSWWAGFKDVLKDSSLATIDGVIPVFDPFEGYYDPNEFLFSRRSGQTGMVFLAAAGGAWGWQALGGPTMDVAVGSISGQSLPHVAYGTGGTWLSATGPSLGNLTVGSSGAAWFAASSRVVQMTGIPVLSSTNVLMTNGDSAWTCVGAAIKAFAYGWGGW